MKTLRRFQTGVHRRAGRVRSQRPPIIIGVAGGSASGKTTVVNEVLARLGSDEVLVIPHDAYYRDRSDVPAVERANINYDHPDALDTAVLVSHLKKLRAGEEIEIPIYDFATHTRRAECRRAAPRNVVIVEGLHVLADPGLRELLSIKVYVDAEADIRFIRRMERDIAERARTRESVVKQYLETARPMHLEYVEPSQRHADVIVPSGQGHDVAVDMLVALIREVIKNRRISRGDITAQSKR